MHAAYLCDDCRDYKQTEHQCMLHIYVMSHLMTSGKVSKEATICSLTAALARESSLKARAIMVMATIWLV